MNKFTLLFALVAALSSCNERAVEPTVPTTSDYYSFKAYKEGTVDGCTVYYVVTAHRKNIHFVRCPNETVETHWAVSKPKQGTEYHSVQTTQ